MLAQIELTQVGAEALAQLEQSTGESRTVLIELALVELMKQKRKALKEALLEGLASGEPCPFDFEAFKKRKREECITQ